MTAQQLEAEYDSMADEYDATRGSATQVELDALVRSLGASVSVLDVGVGTGRFAKPLSDLGYEVTGLDISRRMLSKAREKGLQRLLVGDAYKLPFADKSFDAAIIIHVLHVVVGWTTVMRDMGRVTKGPVMSILRVPQGESGNVSPPTPAAAVSDLAGQSASVRRGYPVRTQHRMWQNELELKARVPPVKLERIRDETISLPVADAIRSLHAKRAMGAQIVPPEIREQMLERIISMTGGQTVQRRVVEDLAVWSADDLSALT